MTVKKYYKDYEKDFIEFAQEVVRTQSFSDEEENVAKLIKEKMIALGFDEALIDGAGNVLGRMGNGPVSVLFDSHMDTVEVHDTELWTQDPFGGAIVDGKLYGRGSSDMKCPLVASIYGAVIARDQGFLKGKTMYVSGSVNEEYCDGVNLKLMFEELSLKPDYVVICEPSDNMISTGHRGKGQFRIVTNGVSTHGSSPSLGKNAVYEMAEIISRVEALNAELALGDKEHNGTIVLSDISCTTASLNAVPSACEIYIDRRLAKNETTEKAIAEMEKIVEGKDAYWEVGELRRTSWTGTELVYKPLHDSWEISKDDPLYLASCAAYEKTFGQAPKNFDYWNFSTNGVTPKALGIPTIGFGCSDVKWAHMIDENCDVQKMLDSADFYANLMKNI